jgi:hypothetical protein
MHQAWHIFQKDTRYLYREIAFLLALLAFFGWLHRAGAPDRDTNDALQILYAVAVAFLIARLIHSEAIPGENQFWITRPYRWHSLLAAKALFVVAFIHVPVLIMQFSILGFLSFPVGAILPGLLWTQVLILLGVTLPCFAIAAMTAGMVQYIAAILVLLAAGFVVSQTRFLPTLGFAPESIEWLRLSIPFIAAWIALPPVLYLQYRHRRTLVSAMFSASIFVGGAVAFMSLPWSSLFAVQASLSKQPLKIAAELGKNLPLKMSPEGSYQTAVMVPVRFSGVPTGVHPQVEMFVPEIRQANGRSVLNGSHLILHRVDKDPNELLLTGTIVTDQSWQSLHLKFFMALFGNTRTRTIPFRAAGADALDGLRCFDGTFDDVVCRAPFRWPGKFVSLRFPWGGGPSFTHLISYSPFPANLQLDPVEERDAGPHWSKDNRSPREVTVEIEEPLAFVRCEVEVPNLSRGKRA